MKLNNKSCLLDSFAKIMQVPPHILATRCGHFGKEGYHTQELIQVALNSGYAVTPIERTPVCQHPETDDLIGVEFPGYCEPEERFIEWLYNSKGVLLGQRSFTFRNHAVAWDKKQVIDTGIEMKYDLILDGRICDTIFVPHTLLRIDKL